MMASAPVTLQKHPQIASPLTVQVKPDASGWRQSVVWNPAQALDASIRSGPLAIVRQHPEATSHVYFRHEKGGLFAVVNAGPLTMIALPGSCIHLPDTEVDMPGQRIVGLAQQPLIPPPPSQVQQVTDQAMILGAGLASRFVPVSGDVTGFPKPGVPLVGDDSVIVTLARHLQAHGIRYLLVNTYYMPDVIKAQLSRVSGLSVTYIDEPAPSGTAGGLVKALQMGMVDKTKPILIMQGDAVTNANLSGLLQVHQQRQPLVTIGVKQIEDSQVSQMAIVVTDRSGEDGESGVVLSFKEKPTLAEAGASRVGSIGFYVLSPAAYDGFLAAGQRAWQRSPEFDYAMDYLPGLLRDNTQYMATVPTIWAHLLEEPFYWSDIGKPDQYLATVRDVYAGHLGLPLPEDISRFYDNNIVYWGQAKTHADALGVDAQGNVIVLVSPHG